MTTWGLILTNQRTDSLGERNRNPKRKQSSGLKFHDSHGDGDWILSFHHWTLGSTHLCLKGITDRVFASVFFPIPLKKGFLKK